MTVEVQRPEQADVPELPGLVLVVLVIAMAGVLVWLFT